MQVLPSFSLFLTRVTGLLAKKYTCNKLQEVCKIVSTQFQLKLTLIKRIITYQAFRECVGLVNEINSKLN